jgi:hypothetical protein
MHAPKVPPDLIATRRRRQRNGYKRTHVANLLQLQELILSKAQADDLAARDLSSLALAWERLEERLRVLRGRPLPGSLKPEPAAKRGRGRAGWTAPVETSSPVEPPAQ